MASDAIDDFYYEEGEEYAEEDTEMSRAQSYEKFGLEWPGGPYVSPVRFYVEGVLDGDIKWNSIDASIRIDIPFCESKRNHFEAMKQACGSDFRGVDHTFYCKIRPFTHNCGAKTIEDVSLDGTDEEKRMFFRYVESFLWHKCNVGILLGSDFIDQGEYQGGTGKAIQTWGDGYQSLPSVWNPNYTWCKEHHIFLFYKNLGEHAHVDYWG